MSVDLLTKQYSEFLSLTEACTGSSESALVKMPFCWKSHAAAQILKEKPCAIHKFHKYILTQIFFFARAYINNTGWFPSYNFANVIISKLLQLSPGCTCFAHVNCINLENCFQRNNFTSSRKDLVLPMKLKDSILCQFVSYIDI